MRFQVLVNEEPRPVELVFGGARDLALVDRWRVPPGVASGSGARDALEFARLASKRWRYYRESISTASDLESFRSILQQRRESEISVLLVVRADWFSYSRILGLAQCRRTYCHHIILEFLAVHPSIVGGLQPMIRGVGAGLIYSLAVLAGAVDVPLIWGEATAFSAPFYVKTCRLPKVEDYFFLRKRSLQFCRGQFRRKYFGEA